jgi:ArsR family transcriptional regulator, arsenate/arsenite/antimonite-responsive transcriptional repressor
LHTSGYADTFGAVTELVLTAKAFADPTRVRILTLLRAGELCVCELGDALRLTQSTLSTHLRVVRGAELVRTRREGKWIYYSLDPEKVALVDALHGFFRRSLAQDPVLGRDGRRLEARLGQRRDGACCVGTRGTSDRSSR